MAKPKYKRERKKAPPSRSKSARKPAAAPVPAKPSTVEKAPLLPPRKRHRGERLPGSAGMVLESLPSRDYALLDSGNGEKLERYGALTVRRPEAQALWLPSLPTSAWDNADAIFTGDTDEEGQGRWRMPKGPLEETWPLMFDDLAYLGRFTSFRHTGVFPEQAAHWYALQNVIRAASRSFDRPVRVLNLFGYTGLASLVAVRAGAEVTHVDASKKAIGWARENQRVAGLEDKPVRWICDDAVKFCAREERRGQTYDIILLDPPAYGRGPKGEVWQLFDHLAHMLDLVRSLQSDRPLMTVLTSYAIRASHFTLHELMQEVFAGMNGRLESGELILRQEAEAHGTGRALSTSMFSRFVSMEAEL